MASKKLYIVETTVHAQEKPGGKKLVLTRGPKPQPVPASLVKELLAAGAIKEVDGDDTEDDDGADGNGGAGGTGGSGDD